MQDRARTQFLSAVVLAVVFSAGGLVGAAVVGSNAADMEGPVAVPAPEEGAENTESGDNENRRRRYMFEQAGATEEQSEYIRSEIIPWYRGALNDLQEDSTFKALDARADSARDVWRSAWRDLEAFYDPREDALEDSARVLIRGVLDEPAQVAYDSLVAEWDRRRRDDDRRHP